MDGAKYHVRKVDPQPTTATRVADVHAWLGRQGVAIPTLENRQPIPKLQLLQFVKDLQIPPVFASYEIARNHGHTIMKTPPYHCELQPIEQVWGIVKKKIAVAPDIAETELSLRNRLQELFAAMEQRQLLGAWRKTVQNCKDYWEIFTQEMKKAADDGASEGGSKDDSEATNDSSSDTGYDSG